MSADTERFGHARTNESQLNARQREILDLLVAGKTNGEIGDALGMTLDGAKWNVSEILGKLGLESREEAAEYWRWRSHPGQRVAAMRGLLGLGTLKWVVGAAAIIVGVGVVGALLSRGEDTASGTLAPFYLEARIEVDDSSRSIGTNVAGLPQVIEHRTSTLKWWQQDELRARWEIENSEDFGSSKTALVADGTKQWRYREEQGTYMSEPLTPLPDGFRVRPFSLSLFIGPQYTGDPSEFLKSIEGWGGPEATMKRIGTEVVLGRETVIYEFSPVSMTSQGGWDASGNVAEEETGVGIGRIWLDEERVIVMRYESDMGTARVRAEVLRLDYDTHFDAKVFRFDPPPGAVESDKSSGDDTIGTGSSGQRGTLVAYSVPAGFFDVGPSAGAFLPYGWTKTERSGAEVTEFELKLAKDDGPAEIVVRQVLAPRGLPPSLTQGDRIQVFGNDAWHVTSGQNVRIALLRDGVAISVTGQGATEEELLAVAESLSRVR